MKTVGFLIASFLIMVVMGTVYTWSVFRVAVEVNYQANTLQSGLPYMTSLFFYALSMMLTGRILTNKNLRYIALVGVFLISIGWFMSSRSMSLLTLTISYGVFIGVGVGMVYGIPVYIVNQRTNRSGLYAGIILSGFGASPLITAPLVHLWLVNHGLHPTFFYMALLSLIVLVPLVFVFSPPKAMHNLPSSPTPSTFNRTTFYYLYSLFLLATTIGLTMIGLSYRIGVVNYGFNANTVTVFVAFFALLNGLSRPIFGSLVDRKGFIFSAKLSIILVVFATFIALMNEGQNLILYSVSMGLYWFNLGAWLAMLPASIKRYFGTEDYAKRYGLMFTAYGFGAIFGTLLSGVLLDLFSFTRYLYVFVIIIFAVLSFLVFKLQRSHSPSIH